MGYTRYYQFVLTDIGVVADLNSRME